MPSPGLARQRPDGPVASHRGPPSCWSTTGAPTPTADRPVRSVRESSQGWLHVAMSTLVGCGRSHLSGSSLFRTQSWRRPRGPSLLGFGPPAHPLRTACGIHRTFQETSPEPSFRSPRPAWTSGTWSCVRVRAFLAHGYDLNRDAAACRFPSRDVLRLRRMRVGAVAHALQDDHTAIPRRASSAHRLHDPWRNLMARGGPVDSPITVPAKCASAGSSMSGPRPSAVSAHRGGLQLATPRPRADPLSSSPQEFAHGRRRGLGFGLEVPSQYPGRAFSSMPACLARRRGAFPLRRVRRMGSRSVGRSSRARVSVCDSSAGSRGSGQRTADALAGCPRPA